MDRTLGTLLIIMGLLLSVAAGYYSIIGLSKLFAGAKVAVIIMASLLEVSKILIAISLHFKSGIVRWLQYYLKISLVILMIITSAGIYGFLSSAFQATYELDMISTKNIELYETKNKIFKDDVKTLQSDKNQITNSISEITKGYRTQNISYDKKGRAISSTSDRFQSGLDKQSNRLDQQLNSITQKISASQDSIMKYERLILELKSTSARTTELGPLKYISTITGYDMPKIVNWFILLLIIVFDPLAIALTLLSITLYSRLQENPVTVPQNTEISNIIEENVVEHQENENSTHIENDIDNQDPELMAVKKFNILMDELDHPDGLDSQAELSAAQKRNMTHQEIREYDLKKKFKSLG